LKDPKKRRAFYYGHWNGGMMNYNYQGSEPKDGEPQTNFWDD